MCARWLVGQLPPLSLQPQPQLQLQHFAAYRRLGQLPLGQHSSVDYADVFLLYVILQKIPILFKLFYLAFIPVTVRLIAISMS